MSDQISFMLEKSNPAQSAEAVGAGWVIQNYKTRNGVVEKCKLVGRKIRYYRSSAGGTPQSGRQENA